MTKLESLKSGNTRYADLLNNDAGRQFSQSVASPALVKLSAALAAAQPAAGSGTSAGGASGASGQSGGEEIDPLSTEGCLRAQRVGEPELDYRFSVLNCLVFDTDHSFWIDISQNAAAERSYKQTIDRHNWLSWGDFVCSAPLSQTLIPLSACLMHDLSWSSLKLLEDNEGSTGDEADRAWNPRNKALADLQFWIAMKCADRVRDGGNDAFYNCASQFNWGQVLSPITLCPVSPADCAYIAVAKLPATNFGWPVTMHDVNHVLETRPLRFLECDIPRLSNIGVVVSSLTNIVPSWIFTASCAVGNDEVSRYELCWDVYGRHSHRGPLEEKEYCVSASSGSPINRDGLLDNSYIRESWRTIDLASSRIIPSNKEYGADFYSQDRTETITITSVQVSSIAASNASPSVNQSVTLSVQVRTLTQDESPTFQYQWQYSTDGVTWEDIGTSNPSINVISNEAVESQFRVSITHSGSQATAISSIARVSWSDLPPTATPTPTPAPTATYTPTPTPTATYTPTPTPTSTPTTTPTPTATYTPTPTPTATYTPTPTPTATYTPTPTRSGRVAPTSSTIDVGQTTEVYAYDVQPPDLEVKFSISGPIALEGRCPTGASGTSGESYEVHSSFTAEGCRAGTGTVRLLASSDDFELDSTTITVR